MPDAAISVTSAPQWATDTSSIRGLFAGTESGGKHAACRPRINAIADDRSFVALQASGSADTQQRGQDCRIPTMRKRPYWPGRTRRARSSRAIRSSTAGVALAPSLP